MYSFSSRVRYSECDESGRLSLEGLVNYLQDCSVFHTESTSRDMATLARDGRAWMLAAWHIEVGSLPRLGDEVVASTWMYESRGLYAMRSFALTSDEGEPHARADSRWFLMDVHEGRPIRIPRDEIACYDRQEVPLDMRRAPKHVKVPEGGTRTKEVVVTEQLLDTNHHVNNARYIELARVAAEVEDPRAIDVLYKRAAVLGDAIVPRVVREGDETLVNLADRGGEAYATLRFAPLPSA